MVIYVPVDCESDSRQGKAKVFINFRGPISETAIWLIKHPRMCHGYCFS